MYKKILSVLIGATLSVSAFAQTTQISPFDKRAEVIRNYGIENVLTMGWYTGVVDSFEMRDLLSRFLPLSNYLSDVLKQTVVLETAKSDRELAVSAKEGTLDIVYTSALMASQLINQGWVPVVGRGENIQSVVVSKKSLESENKDKLKGKIFRAAEGATVTYFAKYSLIKDGIIDPTSPNFQIEPTNQGILLDVLKTGVVDGVIVRDTGARRFIQNNPDYKVAYTADISIGHVLLVSPTFPKDKLDEIKRALLVLTPENPEYRRILVGLDGFSANDKRPFVERGINDFSVSTTVFRVLNEKPL